MSDMDVNNPAAATATSGPAFSAEELNIDFAKLHALSPEVISKQATVSITSFLLGRAINAEPSRMRRSISVSRFARNICR